MFLDSSKWPIKKTELTDVIYPKEISNLQEEFTQIYEKLKRGKSTSQDKKQPKKQAIIVTWNVQLGDCELQTYCLSDPSRRFVLKVNLIQALILLQF